MDYQTHELFHSAFRATRQDSIPYANINLPQSQQPKRDSAVGATRIQFVDQAEIKPEYHEIDRKYLDLILGSRRWKLTASASGSIQTQHYFGNGSAEIKVEGMFDALLGRTSGGIFTNDDQTRIYTRSFDDGAVSQLEGNGYEVNSYESSEEKLVPRSEYYITDNNGGARVEINISMFPIFRVNLYGITLVQTPEESKVVTTNFNYSESYPKAGNFKLTGKHDGGCAGIGLSFVVYGLYITQDKCYIDFDCVFSTGDAFSGGSVNISKEELFYFTYDHETGNYIQKSKVHQSSVPMTIFGTPNSQYKLYQSSGYEGPFDGASVSNITIDIVQEEAI